MVAPLGGNSSFGERSGMQPRDFHSRADGKVLYVGLSLEPQFVRCAYNSVGGAGGRTRTCTPLREEDFKFFNKGRRINVYLIRRPFPCLRSTRSALQSEDYGHPGGHLFSPVADDVESPLFRRLHVARRTRSQPAALSRESPVRWPFPRTAVRAMCLQLGWWCRRQDSNLHSLAGRGF